MKTVNNLFDLHKLSINNNYSKPKLSPIDIDIELDDEFDIEDIQLPIFKAIINDDYDEVEDYTMSDYIERNLNHQTPLMLAVKLNKKKFVKLLLNEACQIDDKDNIALDFANKYNADVEIKKMLEIYETYK